MLHVMSEQPVGKVCTVGVFLVCVSRVESVCFVLSFCFKCCTFCVLVRVCVVRDMSLFGGVSESCY